MRTISDRFLFLFIAFTILGTTKVYIGANLNWLITLTLLGIAVFFSLQNTTLRQRIKALPALIKPYAPMMLGWLLFMAGIAIAAAMNGGVGLYTIAKYLALLLVLVLLLLVGITPNKLEYALTLAMAVAVICLLLFAIFRMNNALVVLGDGRMGWWGAWPGVLWKAGAYVWPFALWRCLKNSNWKTVAVVALSMLAMAVDGSRTSLIWLGLTWAILIGCAIWFKLPGRGLRVHATVMVMGVFIFTLFQPVLLSWVDGRYDTTIAYKIEQIRSFSFSQKKDGSVKDSVPRPPAALPPITRNTMSERVVNGNTTTRKAMLEAGWAQSKQKFPWGGGFGSTTVDDNGSRTVIHMTYLQILGDEGIIALAGYLLMLIYPLYRGLRYLTEKRDCIAERFDTMLAPISILSLYALTGFLHPLSNEITEWALILGAIATIVIYTTRNNVPSSN